MVWSFGMHRRSCQSTASVEKRRNSSWPGGQVDMAIHALPDWSPCDPQFLIPHLRRNCFVLPKWYIEQRVIFTVFLLVKLHFFLLRYRLTKSDLLRFMCTQIQFVYNNLLWQSARQLTNFKHDLATNSHRPGSFI
uniref:Uncharacterized protein n=1 Tax=Oryza brachyantha TaxID=4533 RepID=J3M9E6_ORYBR